MDTPDQLLALPDSLFETSAVADFTGEISLPEIRMGADSYRFEEPLRYHLFFTNTGGALLATGEVSGQAKTACARCLDEVELDLEAPIEAYFVLPGKDELLSEDEEVEYDQLIDKNKVDLTALFQGALALALPLVVLCSEDCAGLCPQCGTNLNHKTCSCAAQQEIDPQNPFAVLKNYRFDSEEQRLFAHVMRIATVRTESQLQ